MMFSLFKKTNVSALMYLLLGAGFILKIRNTANTPNVTGSGGVWNLVTIILYAFWIFAMLNGNVVIKKYGAYATLFGFFAMVSSVVNAQTLSVSFIYNLAIIPYFMIVLSLFEEWGKKYGEKILNLGVYAVTFFAIALFVGYFMMGYQATDDRMYVVTDVYYPLNMLPLMLLMKNKSVKYAAVGLTGFILILSGKRTGFVALLLGLFVYYIVSAFCGRNLKEKSKLIVGMVFAAIVIVLLFSYLTAYFDLDFLERLEIALEEGEGGREEIWGKVVIGLKESTPVELLFGHGLKQVPVLIGSKNALAHCDYLEILYDYGILSLCFYIGFWLSIIGRVIKFIRKKSEYAGILAFVLVIAMFLSTFSNYVIDATYITYCMINLGLIFGITERKDKNNDKSHSTK